MRESKIYKFAKMMKTKPKFLFRIVALPLLAAVPFVMWAERPAAENGANAELRPFTAGTEAFDPKGGHIQGVAASDDALYVAQMTRLLRETVIDRTIDGIAYADGTLYVGMGAKEQPSSKPHRVNIIGRFDAKTLKEIAPRTEFDYGHDTRYGFQDIVFDGERLVAAFYAVKGSPDVAFFDKDLTILGTAFVNCNQGFDILPPPMRGDGRRFVRARTKTGKFGV